MKSQNRQFTPAEVLEQSEIEQADRLVSTNARFPFLSDDQLDTVAILDLEGDCVYSTVSGNHAAVPHAASLGRDSVDPVNSEDRERLKKAIRETIKSGAGQRVEFGVHLGNGEMRYVESETSLLWNEQGKVSKVVVVSREITESQRLLAGFRSMVVAMSDWLWEIDAEGVLTYASPQVKHLLGYEPEELIGKRRVDLMIPEDAARVAAIIAEAIHGRRPFVNIESRNLHKEGRVVVVETTAVPIIDHRGVLRGYRGIGRDITQRKLAEEQLRKLSRAVEQSPAVIVITDVRGTIEYVNPKFCEITGYSTEEAIGQNPRLLKSGEMPPEEYRRMWQTITSGGEWRGEFHNRKRNGELYWEFASVSPIRDAAGKITHFLAVKEDVTDRKRTDEERIKLVSELQRALAKVKTLSGLLPICAWCKRVRDDEGYWKQIESYVEAHSDAEFTHGICPDCAEKHRQTLKSGKEQE